jgi:DNA-binding MarR family transcriptional regulator
MIQFLKTLREIDEQMPPQMAQCLLVVAQSPGLTYQEISKRTGLALSSVSRNIMALGEWNRRGEPGYGLVEAIDDLRERRRKIAFLTIKGRNLVKKLMAMEGANADFNPPTARDYLNGGHRPVGA